MTNAPLKDFSELAQEVWRTHSVLSKLATINKMILECRSSDEKKAKFARDARAMNAAKLDKFAADLMLVDTDKAIR